MDSLIRLDALMPIAPLVTGNNSERSTRNDGLNQNTQQEDAVIDITEIPDVIDLTMSKGDSKLQSISKVGSDTAITSFTYSSRIIDEEASGENIIHNHRSPTKHKLNSSNHTPAKVSKTDSYVSSLLFENSKRNEPNILAFPNNESLGFCRLGFDQDRTRPSSSTNMKPHTITSNNCEMPTILNTAGSSKEFPLNVGLRPKTHEDFIDTPNQFLVKEEPRPNINNVIPPPSRGIKGVDLSRDAPVINNFQQRINVIESENRRNKDESPMFYQLLDMFPDIDLEFLKKQCISGLDINHVSEIILEMTDYPKSNFLPFEKPIGQLSPPPNIVVNVNLNTIKLSQSKASSANQNLNNEEVKLISTENITRHNGNDMSKGLTAVPASTSQPVSMPDIDQEISRVAFTARNTSSTVASLVKEENVRNENNCVQSQFSFLMEIFPDADPCFMEEKSKLKGNDLRNFISECMEKTDYPKVKTVSEKRENEVEDDSAEVGLYTTNFNIENFIKLFPDPYGYFLDDKRNCQSTEHGLRFLKRRYRLHAIKVITMKYKEFKYNLVKTCEFLDQEPQSRVSKRGLNDIKMPEETNLPFLQEACFIEHKTEIKNYLDGIAAAKRLSFEQAEARGELIECGCCFQNVLFEDCAACNEGHLFCKTCVQKSVEVRIGDGHTTFPCLQECDSTFSLKLLEVLVDATMFSRLLQRIQLDEVRAADIDGLEVCPFCDFAIILPPETSIFKCLNPECLKESCRKCHRLSHIPQRCEELESDIQARARKYIEDEMTRALVRTCYKCKKSFIKMDGCNKMTCTCGAKMCYICREPIVDYKHFNGPGGEAKQKCPLYSTEKLLHVDAVEAVAKKALEEVISENPDLKLKHDPSKILPRADQAKTHLPPGVNEEAQRLINILQNLQQNNGAG